MYRNSQRMGTSWIFDLFGISMCWEASTNWKLEASKSRCELCVKVAWYDPATSLGGLQQFHQKYRRFEEERQTWRLQPPNFEMKKRLVCKRLKLVWVRTLLEFKF